MRPHAHRQGSEMVRRLEADRSEPATACRPGADTRHPARLFRIQSCSPWRQSTAVWAGAASPANSARLVQPTHCDDPRKLGGNRREKELPSHTFINEIGAGSDQGQLVASGVSVIQMAFFVTLLWSELTPTGCLIAPWIWIISGA